MVDGQGSKRKLGKRDQGSQRIKIPITRVLETTDVSGLHDGDFFAEQKAELKGTDHQNRNYDRIQNVSAMFI